MEREDRPAEQEAVRTTIVGGRPPGSGKAVGPIPRGIEVLVKKAAVDPDFKQILMEKRARAANEINLKLEPAEIAMLTAVPAGQLETIIANTEVADLTRAAFLGRAAAVMLAALGVSTVTGCSNEGPPVTGERPDRPDRPEKYKTTGIDPERPPLPEPKPQPSQPESDQGATPDPRPDKPVSKGLQPDVPEPKPEPPKPDPDQQTRGIRPDRPKASRGVRPDLVTPPGLSAEELKKRVEAMVALLNGPELDEARFALLGMGPAALPALREIKPPTPAVGEILKQIIEHLEETEGNPKKKKR